MTALAAMPGEEEIAAIIDARAFDPTARWREGEPRDRRRRSAKQRARAILDLFAARAGKEAPVELWRGERKVSIYSDVVIRVWGTNCASEMSDEPRTLDSVNAAVEWLFAPILAEKERAERERDALLSHAAACGEEPDLLILSWRDAADRALAAEAALATAMGAIIALRDGPRIESVPDCDVQEMLWAAIRAGTP